MRCQLILYRNDTRHSKFDLKIKQILTHIQVMLNTRQTSVEYKI